MSHEQTEREACQLAPRQLYRVFWSLVPMVIFDQSKLDGWDKWETYFEQRLDSQDESVRLPETTGAALTCIDEMLASLNDRFTTAFAPEEVTELNGELANSEPGVESRLLQGGIGYLRVPSFMSENLLPQVQEALASLSGMQALVLDLRGNEGGRLQGAFECAQLLIAEGEFAVVETRVPGEGYMRRRIGLRQDVAVDVSEDMESGETTTNTSARLAPVLSGQPIAVLVDEETASSAELLAGSLRENGATVVGARTRGKGISQQLVPIGDFGLYITMSRFLTPGGVWFGDVGQTDATGVVIDVPVGSARGETGDAALTAAIDVLTNKLEVASARPQTSAA